GLPLRFEGDALESLERGLEWRRLSLLFGCVEIATGRLVMAPMAAVARDDRGVAVIATPQGKEPE
ncbi:MAG TPA: hypothetical protein VI893_05545, partial [Thermoplasmata archaeon]|nr:hypothetical protein [Thermoplasmata archaeon]